LAPSASRIAVDTLEELDRCLAELEAEAHPPTLLEVLVVDDFAGQWLPPEGSRYALLRASRDVLSDMCTLQLFLDPVDVAMLLNVEGADTRKQAAERLLFLASVPYSWGLGMVDLRT